MCPGGGWRPTPTHSGTVTLDLELSVASHRGSGEEGGGQTRGGGYSGEIDHCGNPSALTPHRVCSAPVSLICILTLFTSIGPQPLNHASQGQRPGGARVTSMQAGDLGSILGQ